MASPDSGAGPKPYKQRKASTIFLRVPYADWAAVRLGHKREFRAASGAVSGLKFVDPPTPVVAYTNSPAIGWESQLMVLERRWQEPLAAISEESLAAEGFATFEEFRAYWCNREHRRFTPTRMVVAYRVRPFVWDTNGDQTRFAEQIFQHLYGEWTPEEFRPPETE